MRGQLIVFGGVHKSPRIIPARAGPTTTGVVGIVIFPDHPRSCGANIRVVIHAEEGDGSSPLVRGQPKADAGDVETRRIIPARAGPTCASLGTCQRGADHPRSCGANAGVIPIAAAKSGSSPLVRGQHQRKHDVHFIVRIIPARAGPTMPESEANARREDHPRSCGANERCFCCHDGTSGSSPLVRGQPSSPEA